MSGLLVLYCAVVASVLVIGRTITERNFATVVEHSSLVLRSGGATSQDIRATNELLLALEQFRRTFTPWSVAFITIAERVPTPIVLTEITVDRNASLRVDGRAPEREGLLVFRDALQTLPYLSEVVVPFSNLLLRERIDFTIEAHVDRAAIGIKNRE
ncbi:MAG: hypothetical protein Q7R80_04940 [bacterium]|nr:hypothetical protein [bacterium]